MAEDLGSQLLAEVAEEPLGDFVRSCFPPRKIDDTYFDLPPLRDMLHAVVNCQLSSHEQSSLPAIELASLAPGGGKTQLLYHLCAAATVSREAGGQQACVIIIDCDGKFHVPRLVQQLSHIITKSQPEASEGAIQAALQLALTHVHVFRPPSLSSTSETLLNLTAYLFDRSLHQSIDRSVAFIAIDSISAFYWQDCADAQDAAFLATLSGHTTNASFGKGGYPQLASALHSACKALRCVAVVTNWDPSYNPPLETGERQSHALRCPVLVRELQMPVLRLIVQRIPVRQFPPGITLEEASKEAEDRLQAVQEGKFICKVNEYGMDARALQALRMLPERFGFGFTITESGISFEPPQDL